jgi:hypothetical protein
MVELQYAFQNRETGACGAFAIIIVGLRPAEICHDAIAEVLGNISAEPSDRLGCGTMVAGNHLTPFFGVKLSGDLRRTDEIAKENGQMPPLPR